MALLERLPAGGFIVRCRDDSLRKLLWPVTFTSHERAAVHMCRWAARRGAQVHPALRLVWAADRGNYMRVSSPVPAGTALMSIPLSICATSSREDREVSSTGTTTPLEQICHFFCRAVADPRSRWAPYVQFLHDSYNADDSDQDDALGSSEELQKEIDKLTAGNKIRAEGVPNAPFLGRADLVTPRARAEWVRHTRLLRQVEQSVPHFACPMAAWGMSMALSRGILDDEGELSVLPIIDMCNHSFNPSAHVTVVTSEKLQLWRLSQKAPARLGVRGSNELQPHAHLYAIEDIPAGGSVTLLYDERGTETDEDVEMWRLRYGFVPRRPERKQPATRAGLDAQLAGMLRR
jgi:hypothetical protein